MPHRRFVRPARAFLAILAGSTAAVADPQILATSTDGVWTVLSEMPADVANAPAYIRANKMAVVSLNLDAIKIKLATAPREFTAAGWAQPLLLEFPMPDGTFQRFAVVESPIMEPGFQTQFPDFKTYSAKGLDDPTARMRFDVTTYGLRSQTRTAEGALFIDPVSSNDTTHYGVYDRVDLANDDGGWKCQVGDGQPGGGLKADALDPMNINNGSGGIANYGTELRNYRIAVAGTGEYSVFHGGTTNALANIVTTVNRVNGVYEDDLAVRLTLIANNNLIVYPTAASDPYSGTNAFAMLTQNQTNLNTVIGSANFDIGHVLSAANDGGVAALQAVCKSVKAQGVSTLPSPKGDPFDIDYVAHEIGHQFAGTHTFNNCGGSDGLACEPGSGITIMSYAGICGTQNVANNSIPILHALSLNQMRNWIVSGSGATCFQTVATGNSIPDVEAGPNFTIPKSTPFTLVGTGSDPDGDPLTYSWEQTTQSGTSVAFNSGLGNFPDTGVNPIIVSRTPLTVSERTIPRSPNLWNNTQFKGETLPTTNRNIPMRLVVRDGKGGVKWDSMTITSNATAGPFVVTAPNTNVSWPGNSSQNVTWNVALTNAAPINTSQVQIELTTNQGTTWTDLGTFANSGSAAVTVPNINTTTARIRVKAVGNIYFDVSNVNFTITQTASCDPDCDSNGSLTIDDFICFQTLFALGDPAADCDTSGSLSIDDFICFQTLFALGC
jgi:Metallo-peptidase family M12B Reprolysin-like